MPCSSAVLQLDVLKLPFKMEYQEYRNRYGTIQIINTNGLCENCNDKGTRKAFQDGSGRKC